MAEPKLTIRQVADRTGLPTGTISYAARTGRLHAYKVSLYGPYWFDPADVDAWLESLRTPAPKKRHTTKRNRRTPAGK